MNVSENLVKRQVAERINALLDGLSVEEGLKAEALLLAFYARTSPALRSVLLRRGLK